MTLSLSYNSGGVCEITLNRPEVLNRFDNQLQIDLAHGIGHTLRRIPPVRVVVLASTRKAFSAGGGFRADAGCS